MNELPYLAALATRHAWVEREYARLHADIVEARIIARARSAERAAEKRAWVRDRLTAMNPARRREAVPYCARAAARSSGDVRMVGSVR
jgi:hypothetical protein